MKRQRDRETGRQGDGETGRREDGEIFERKFPPLLRPSVPPSLCLSDEPYRIAGVESVMTPALAIYPEIVDANIEATLRVMGGDTDRWRPHVKTSKLGFVMRLLTRRGVTSVKC